MVLTNHFLDSNIVLCSLIYWQQPGNSITTTYMQYPTYNRHISSNVVHECRAVIKRFKDVVPEFIEKIELDDDVSEVLNSDYSQDLKQTYCAAWVDETYIDSYINNKNPKLDENEEKTLRSYVTDNKEYVAKILLAQNTKETSLGEFDKSISLFKNNLDRLYNSGTSIVRKHDTYRNLREYERLYRSELDHLQSKGTYNLKDILLMMDSYHIKLKIEEELSAQTNLAFLTNDRNDILNHKDHIERSLSGIYVRDIITFLT